MTAVISRPAVRTAPASPGRDPFIDVLRLFGMALFVPGMAPVYGAGAILAGLMLTWSAPVPPRPGPFEAEATPGGPATPQIKSP